MLRWCYWIEIGKDRSTLGNPAHADLRVVFSRKLKALLTSIWCRTRGPSHFPKSIILLVWPTVSPFFVKQKKGWINNQSNLYLVRFVSSYRKIIWQVQETLSAVPVCRIWRYYNFWYKELIVFPNWEEFSDGGRFVLRHQLHQTFFKRRLMIQPWSVWTEPWLCFIALIPFPV